ncbi:MAG: hypothetical protein ACSHXF_15490 [Aquaticitalea sp.]
MKYITILLITLCFSCGNERMVQLPEIDSSKITDVKDVSPAYIFYDESKKDSIEINRKNLIISTNWLVNVDKRLKLKQAIPAIKKLQDKKRDAKMHKNEAAKNYYSCNDTSIKSLGFLDFTEVIYHNGIDKTIIENHTVYKNPTSTETTHVMSILFKANDSITINTAHTDKSEFVQKLKFMDSIQNKMMGVVYLKFNENLSFQDYITYKSMVSKIKLKHATISDDEYIFN